MANSTPGTGGASDNMRGPINIKSADRKSMMEPNAKDSMYDKNEAGKEYMESGGVPKDNLGGENTRSEDMNIGTFKQAVAAFVGRDPSYFCENVDGSPGADKLTIAVNNAQIFLQRQIDFEYARGFVDLVYHATPGQAEGILLDQAVRQGTACPVEVKKVVNLFTPEGFGRVLSLRQKTFRGLTDLIRGSYERNGASWAPENRSWYSDACTPQTNRCWISVWGHGFRDPVWYQHGRRLVLYPSPQPKDGQYDPTNIEIVDLPMVGDVVYLVDDFKQTDVDCSNFILKHCYDYMLWRTIAELNVFLKDDDQVGVSSTKMTEALENIRGWNADLIDAGADME